MSARRRILQAWLSAVLLAGALDASAEIRSGSFESASLGTSVAYVADLPDSYAQGERRYPVVYALHGLFESSAFWERRGLAPLLAAFRANGGGEFILVAVDGGNTFFVNSPAGRYEDLVTKDLVAHVEKSYRVVAGRQGRALLGISMGGYAALRLALTRPGDYAAVATHSAMLLTRPPTAEDGARRGQMAAFGRVFGNPIDPALWAANDPLALAAKADPKAMPALSFDCGDADRYGLAEGNRLLHEALEKRGVRHEFALHPGDHGYEYVRSVLERSLRFLSARLGGQ
jgi:S-formylglutathione hydrolase FrmB